MLFLGTFLAYLFCNSGIYWYSASERVRYAQIKAIVEYGVFYVDQLIPTFPYPQHWDLSLSPNGHYYPNKPPGLTFLGVPIISITSALGIPFPLEGFYLMLLSCFFTSTSVVVLYSLCMKGFEMSEKTSLVVSLIYGFGTFAFPHAVTFYANSFSALFVLLTVYFLIDRNEIKSETKQITGLLVSGIFAGYLLLLDYSNLFLLLPFLLYILFSKNRKYSFVFFLPVIFWLLILLTYHYVAFGDPFVTTYTYAVHTRNTFDWNNTRPIHDGLLLYLFNLRRGLFVYSPILLLSISGFYLMFKEKQDRKEGFLLLSSFLIILFFFSAIAYRNGWIFGSRRLDPILPLICIPIGRILENPKDIFFGRLQNNSFFEKYRESIFQVIFTSLFIISFIINGIGAITDVHPTAKTLYDHNLELLFSGKLSSLVWNTSPVLGLLIVLPAIVLIIYAFHKADW